MEVTSGGGKPAGKDGGRGEGSSLAVEPLGGTSAGVGGAVSSFVSSSDSLELLEPADQGGRGI